jgi:hypothetical protein
VTDRRSLLMETEPAPCPLCGADSPAVARINRRIRYRCGQCSQEFELLASQLANLLAHEHSLDGDMQDRLERGAPQNAKNPPSGNSTGFLDVVVQSHDTASGAETALKSREGMLHEES